MDSQCHEAPKLTRIFGARNQSTRENITSRDINPGAKAYCRLVIFVAAERATPGEVARVRRQLCLFRRWPHRNSCRFQSVP